MARPKKDGRRANGIQGKSGYLYIVITQNTVKDGVKKGEKKWISKSLQVLGVTRFELAKQKPHKCIKERRFGHPAYDFLTKILTNHYK